MSRFFYLKEVQSAAEVQQYLAKPELHWKPEHSAYELATSWVGAGDIPERVRDVLDTSERYRGAKLIEAFFEREVDLRTPGRPSQTDLLALVQANGYAVIAVEGKAEESFGPIVREWEATPGKAKRLKGLTDLFGLTHDDVSDLRYQLLHRTASAVFEAERYGADRALMLVHSFSPARTSLPDFRAFAEVLGFSGADENAITSGRAVGSIELRLGWVADSATPAL